MKKKHVVKKVLGGFCFIAVIAAAIAVTMLLWNALIPSIIGWTAINYWQAAGLLLLSKLLFGGFRGGHGFGWRNREHHGRHFELRKKMKGMSREERIEFFRKQMHKGSPFDDFSFDRERAEDIKPEN